MLNNIEAERVRYRLTKEELAKKLNVSVKTYYNWINEETDAPISKLVIMARMFGTKVDYLIEGMDGVPSGIKCLRNDAGSEGRR
ncbi:MAG: helix-turn-helix domain-containing protein [Clostridium sp.]|nr:helix-turn-helix domain-containing protein [Clostridium sp.]